MALEEAGDPARAAHAAREASRREEAVAGGAGAVLEERLKIKGGLGDATQSGLALTVPNRATDVVAHRAEPLVRTHEPLGRLLLAAVPEIVAASRRLEFAWQTPARIAPRGSPRILGWNSAAAGSGSEAMNLPLVTVVAALGASSARASSTCHRSRYAIDSEVWYQPYVSGSDTMRFGIRSSYGALGDRNMVITDRRWLDGTNDVTKGTWHGDLGRHAWCGRYELWRARTLSWRPSRYARARGGCGKALLPSGRKR